MLRVLVIALSLASMICAAPRGANPELLRVRNIYVMSMPRGLDQYLANLLVREGKYQVVTDAELADAVLTDRLGADFEQRFQEMFAPKPEVTEKEEEARPASSESNLSTALAWGEAGPQRTSSFSRAAGNLFLVDRGTKVVVWSSYRRPKRASADELYRISDWLVEQLHEDRRKAEKEFPSGPVAPPPAAPVSPSAAQPDPVPAAAPEAAPESASPAPPSGSSPPDAP